MAHGLGLVLLAGVTMGSNLVPIKWMTGGPRFKSTRARGPIQAFRSPEWLILERME